jgi:hypothetical protein
MVGFSNHQESEGNCHCGCPDQIQTVNCMTISEYNLQLDSSSEEAFTEGIFWLNPEKIKNI